MRVLALSDTHAPRFWKNVPPALLPQLAWAEVILHAGDVCTADVLDELSTFAPVRAVLGNNDGPDVAAWGAPETAQFELDGLKVGMVHDSGPSDGRLRRLARRFPHAALVVFGHSHIPWDESTSGLRIVNPGSPTDKRRQPHGTVARLEVADGAVRDVTFVEVS
jgi:putative phosphoesterase